MFDNLKTLDKENVKSYWIVDETLMLKKLFTNMTNFNDS